MAAAAAAAAASKTRIQVTNLTTISMVHTHNLPCILLTTKLKHAGLHSISSMFWKAVFITKCYSSFKN